jgi:hypothetical protein
MTEREKLIRNRTAYMTLGDVDKPFHRPECECQDCEFWRKLRGRPTHTELRAMPPEEPRRA